MLFRSIRWGRYRAHRRGWTERFHLPVEGNDHVVEREAGGVEVVHVPDPVMGKFPTVCVVEGVVKRHYKGQEPCDDGQNLVGDDRVLAVRVPLGKGVDWGKTGQ